MAVSEADAPFVEPYALAGNPRGFRSKGNTALAVKRALAHLGFLPWEPDKWDLMWNEKVNDASAAWKRKRGIIPESSSDGSWGEQAHTVMRQTWFQKGDDRLDAFDGESQRLLKEEAKAKPKPPPPSSPDAVRASLTEFARKAIGRSDWRYSQNRAVKLGIDPAGPNTSDCSGTVIQAFDYARRKTGIAVPDPAIQSWTGYGNTNYYQDDHPKVTSGQYLVGDLAHYNGHVTMCYQAGSASSALWLSFGSEPPSSRKLNYRSDFRFVVRPPLVPK